MTVYRRKIKKKHKNISPSHTPIGNSMTDTFNRTRLDMLGTLDTKKKINWKSYVHLWFMPTTVQGTKQTTGILMFGRHPRLPVDVALGMELLQDEKNLSS